MNKLLCKNKRCLHEFVSTENKKIVKCPCCNSNVYNMELIINGENYLYIESMIENIERCGDKTFEMIDNVYHDAITRVKVRGLYFKTLEQLKDK
jgi:hypothetical protein